MDREKMLYHANANGSLNFDVRSMKSSTKENLQFLLDGGYLEWNDDSVWGSDRTGPWQDYRITSTGKVLLAIYRLDYAHRNERDTPKHEGRMVDLQEALKACNQKIEYFDPSLSNHQRKALNYMKSKEHQAKVAQYVGRLENIEREEQELMKDLSPYKVLSSEEWHEAELKRERQRLGIESVPGKINLDNIDIDELSLVSMFNMSTGLGPKGTDDTRSDDYVLKKSAEEMGELALEINIDQGLSYKEPGKDGIKGEAVDLAICAMDMFALQCPGKNAEEIEREFLSYMLTKLNKWRDSIR